MGRWLASAVLTVMAASASAWPWTTPEDCQREHATKAQGEWSLNAIYAACKWKYGADQTTHDASKGECFIARIDEPKSEVAFKMLMKQCFDEAPPQPPSPFDKYGQTSSRPELPTGCEWDEGTRPGLYDHILDANAYASKVEGQARRCKARAAE